MKMSMYQASVPAFIRALENLAAILEKAAAHAQARKIEPAVLLSSRLFPDMLPLTRQVQIARDSAVGGAARLAGVEVPTYENTETSFAELIARLRTDIAFLATFKPEQIDGTEDKTVSWQTRSSTKSMHGLPYLVSHVLPNVYFHVTTAYDILRHNGVELGKRDFLGNG
jgi:uncharacterized protein